ncbi:hypothetical protein BJ741DRAFT_384735 [Chytriomyces cf. hyalinus JEL632]|nr:hypothetical protein BJ741DRAFT_384735 [Chytriomyces cf. hyalinus JEL632]
MFHNDAHVTVYIFFLFFFFFTFFTFFCRGQVARYRCCSSGSIYILLTCNHPPIQSWIALDDAGHVICIVMGIYIPDDIFFLASSLVPFSNNMRCVEKQPEISVMNLLADVHKSQCMEGFYSTNLPHFPTEYVSRIYFLMRSCQGQKQNKRSSHKNITTKAQLCTNTFPRIEVQMVSMNIFTSSLRSDALSSWPSLQVR